VNALRRLFSPCLLLAAGCQQIDLAEEWRLDRLRLLAIRAEPAEPAPGELVTFTSLRHVPEGAAWSSIWFGCVLGAEQGCALDAALVERLEQLDTLPPEEQAALFAELQAAGLLGVEPLLAPAWTVPADALAGLTEAEALEGVSATLQVTLATESDTELVLKRVPVSLAATPNTNPDVARFSIDENPLAPDVAVTVERGVSYELEAAVAALETYTYVTTDGVTEERTEELEWRWYATVGELGDGFGPPDGDDEDTSRGAIGWTAPDEAGPFALHAVVLDGRGGMGWWTVSGAVE
jgi:hypothetical protein